ncbi:MAG: DUF2760 domain-containing protein [Candidatus Bruticola sp.]
MRIVTAFKAFFKALFDGTFAEKLSILLGEKAEQPQSSVSTPSMYPGAVGLLALLQREGRLIDFLQENLDNVPEAQIGAVVKSTVYKGCRKALKDYLELEPVRSEEEGSEITVDEGFDPNSIRLVGKVEGNPPFKGILRHQGWRLVKANLPQSTDDNSDIICPAEVEL